MGTGAVEVREYLHTRDLATRRGGTGIGLIKDAEEFLYC